MIFDNKTKKIFRSIVAKWNHQLIIHCTITIPFRLKREKLINEIIVIKVI